MRPNPQETADLVTFTEEIRNGKLQFLCSAKSETCFRSCQGSMTEFSCERLKSSNKETFRKGPHNSWNNLTLLLSTKGIKAISSCCKKKA